MLRWSGSSATRTSAPLYLNGARLYDPRVGEYTSPEPLVLIGPAMLHPWAYTPGNPYFYVDPTGRDWITWDDVREAADDQIAQVADALGGRVLTQNARDFPAALRVAVDGRVGTHVDTLARILSGSL